MLCGFEAIRDAVFSKWAVFALIAIVCVCAAAVYVSRYYIMPSLDPAYADNNEFTLGTAEQEAPVARFTLYYATWCPHSQAAKKVWDKFADANAGKTFAGVAVTFATVDCENDAATANAAGVEEYPTMILAKGPETWRFDSAPTAESLAAFLDKALG